MTKTEKIIAAAWTVFWLSWIVALFAIAVTEGVQAV